MRYSLTYFTLTYILVHDYVGWGENKSHSRTPNPGTDFDYTSVQHGACRNHPKLLPDFEAPVFIF